MLAYLLSVYLRFHPMNLRRNMSVVFIVVQPTTMRSFQEPTTPVLDLSWTVLDMSWAILEMS